LAGSELAGSTYLIALQKELEKNGVSYEEFLKATRGDPAKKLKTLKSLKSFMKIDRKSTANLGSHLTLDKHS
jgi:hypothetical protein